jgi:hypothetical protein
MSLQIKENRAHHDGDAFSEASSDLEESSSTARSTRSPSDASSGHDAHARAAKNLGISASEQQIVNCSRWMFLFCLLVSASALAMAVFFFARADEVGNFTAEVRCHRACLPCITTKISCACCLPRSSKAWLMIS